MPLAAPADKNKPDTLYHNGFIQFSILFTIVTLSVVALFDEVDVQSFASRSILVFFTLAVGVVFTVQQTLLRRRDIPLADLHRNYVLKCIGYSLVGGSLLFSFLAFQPTTPFQIALFTYLWLPLLIPHTVVSAVFYLIMMIRSFFNLISDGEIQP